MNLYAKKSYKSILSICVSLFLIILSILFIGCRSKNNNQEPNPFEEIAEFLKTKGEFEKNEYIYSLDGTKEDNPKNFIIYDSINNTLSLNGENENFQEFSISLPYANSSTNTTGYTCSVIALKPQILHTEFYLQTVPFTNINATTKLPDFQLKDNQDKPATDSDKQQVRSTLSNALNILLSKFNTFYVEQVKNNDQTYNYTTYKYFQLPVIQTE